MDARKENISKFILFPQIILLAAGILLSGSRTVFFLAMAVCLFFVITHKKARIPILAALGVLFVIVAVYVGLTGNMQNIGRFLTTSIHSSTFLGRLLYFKDGLRLLASHPFGLGYLGYYFLEPSIQTGVYSIRFIHNDFLQLSLDIGILPCLLLLWAFISNIFGKGKNMKNRLILSVIAIHCLVDFDLEFTAIWFLILLSWDMYHGKELNIAAGGKTAFYKILAGLLAAAAIYTGAAMIPRYLENAKLSATLLPFYTEAKKEVLAQETNVVQAEQMSKELLQQNGYVSEAYDILAATAYQQNDYLKMAEYKKKSVELQKYNMDAYERYIVLLSGAIETVIANEDTQTLQSLMQYVVDVDTRRKEVEEETDALAYLIRDLPDFTMAEEAEDYIVQVKQLLGK